MITITRQDLEDAFRSFIRTALDSISGEERQACLQFFIDILVDEQEKSE